MMGMASSLIEYLGVKVGSVEGSLVVVSLSVILVVDVPGGGTTGTTISCCCACDCSIGCSI